MSLTSKLNVSQLQLQDGGFCVPGNEQFGQPTADSRVLFRADYNVPLEFKDDQPNVTDPRRIESTIPTLKALLALNPKRIVIVSHLGRPKGNRNPKMSLAPVVPILSGLLEREVIFVENWGGPETVETLNGFPDGSVILMENVRFFIEEEGKGEINGEKAKADAGRVAEFRALLSSLCDLYVNDAFACCHRAHSSMVGVDVPLRVAGLLVKKELDYFEQALSTPTRPYLAILGGAKVSDKIKVIDSLLDRVNEMVIAGGMTYTFRKVMNSMNIGESIFDEAGAEIVASLVAKAEANGVRLTLPTDFITADDFSPDANTGEATVEGGIPDGWQGLDVGPASRAAICEAIERCNTIVWNGPPGVFEFEKFQGGTRAVLEAVAAATDAGKTTIIGGGDSAAAAGKWGYDARISHISTGGGASLELLEGKELPGFAALSELS